MELIPIPYFGMIMFFFVAPALTFGFVGYTKRLKADVEKKRYQKEILELEIRKEELHLKMLEEENKKYDRMIEDNTGKKFE
jgi:hypothetical protein